MNAPALIARRLPAGFCAGAAFCLLFSAARAATAEVLVKPFRAVSVSSAVAGALQTLSVQEGESAKTGQPLAILAHEQEQLEVDRLTKVLEKRDFDDRGTAKLFKDKIVSEDEAVEKRIEREIAELQLRRAKLDLAHKTLLAPLDGIVVAKNARPANGSSPAPSCSSS